MIAKQIASDGELRLYQHPKQKELGILENGRDRIVVNIQSSLRFVDWQPTKGKELDVPDEVRVGQTWLVSG